MRLAPEQAGAVPCRRGGGRTRDLSRYLRWGLGVLCVVGCALLGCSKDEDHESESRPYAIQMPVGWDVTEGYEGALRVATEPVPSAADLPRATVAVAFGRVVGRLTMDEYWSLSQRSIEESLGPYQEHEAGEVRIAGATWRWMIYSFDSRHSPGVRMKCLVYATRRYGYTYAITAGTSAARFDKFRSIFEESAQTFEFR